MTPLPAIKAKTPTPVATLVLTLSIATPLSACQISFSAGNGTATTMTSPSGPSTAADPKADLQQITAQQVRDKYGGGPVTISCPTDLPLTVGAAVQCTLDQDGKRFELSITMTRVSSPTDAHWDWQIGHQLAPI